jgi:DNA mismatch endonuclease, patch repair protein
MARVRSQDTTPERVVRRLLTEFGYRYRLHRSDLPGKPDIAFIGRRKAIFVHGCFWHGHDCVRGAREPKTNSDYWRAKIAGNRARDIASREALEAMGWRVLPIWECQLRDRSKLSHRLAEFLDLDVRDGDAD